MSAQTVASTKPARKKAQTPSDKPIPYKMALRQVAKGKMTEDDLNVLVKSGAVGAPPVMNRYAKFGEGVQNQIAAALEALSGFNSTADLIAAGLRFRLTVVDKAKKQGGARAKKG